MGNTSYPWRQWLLRDLSERTCQKQIFQQLHCNYIEMNMCKKCARFYLKHHQKARICPKVIVHWYMIWRAHKHEKIWQTILLLLNQVYKWAGHFLERKKGKQPISRVYFQNTSSLRNPKEESLFGMENKRWAMRWIVFLSVSDTHSPRLQLSHNPCHQLKRTGRVILLQFLEITSPLKIPG